MLDLLTFSWFLGTSPTLATRHRPSGIQLRGELDHWQRQADEPCSQTWDIIILNWCHFTNTTCPPPPPVKRQYIQYYSDRLECWNSTFATPDCPLVSVYCTVLFLKILTIFQFLFSEPVIEFHASSLRKETLTFWKPTLNNIGWLYSMPILVSVGFQNMKVCPLFIV